MSVNSMTGYGSTGGMVADRSVLVEVRSVNARYLDVRCRLSWPDLGLEVRVEQLVRRRLGRGHVEVRCASAGPSPTAVRANLSVANQVKVALEELRSGLALAGAVSLDLIAAHPEVMSHGGAPAVEEIWTDLEPLLSGAIDQLTAARSREGAALAKDIAQRVTRLGEIAEQIGEQAASRPEEFQKQLDDKLARLGKPSALDPTRLAQEVALAAQRLDVTEERVRLATHVDSLKELVDGGGSVGRRIDFMMQEIQREIGTIAAKSQSAAVSRLVVEARAEVEKMREQAQNLE